MKTLTFGTYLAQYGILAPAEVNKFEYIHRQQPLVDEDRPKKAAAAFATYIKEIGQRALEQIGLRLYKNYAKAKVIENFASKLQCKLWQNLKKCIKIMKEEEKSVSKPVKDAPEEVLKSRIRMECYERLYKDFFYRKRSKEIISDQKLFNDMRNCCFRPEISDQSKEYKSVNVSDLVTRLSTERRKSPYRVPLTTNTLEVMEHCTFTPRISRPLLKFCNNSMDKKIVKRLEFITPIKSKTKDKSTT